jgi:CO/xanthine dehydrogenase FAD-binding subunit
VADRPLHLAAVGNRLAGSALRDSDIREAVAMATGDLAATSDLHATALYRRRVARALATRALRDARDSALGSRS